MCVWRCVCAWAPCESVVVYVLGLRAILCVFVWRCVCVCARPLSPTGGVNNYVDLLRLGFSHGLIMEAIALFPGDLDAQSRYCLKRSSS